MTYRRRKSAHKTNPINRGFKERTIVATLEEYIPADCMVLNKQISGGQSKRRPDILIPCDGYNIIVEIDERQHRSYKDDDRETDLIADLQGLPLVLIRFNPDGYRSGGRSHRSLFSKTRGDRIYQIGCPKKYEERITVLLNCLNYYFNNKPDQPYVEHKLFFNGYKVAEGFNGYKVAEGFNGFRLDSPPTHSQHPTSAE